MNLKEYIRDIPDFPKPGILFRDITPLFLAPEAFHEVIRRMAQSLEGKGVEVILAPEARGFTLGAVLAYELNIGFVPVRKPGKLPYKSIKYAYDLEYGSNEIEIHEDALKPGQRVAVVDDLLATGGTAGAACKLAEQLGAEVVAVRFAMELTELDGRRALGKYDVDAVIQY